jgi:hypothetical protein
VSDLVATLSSRYAQPAPPPLNPHFNRQFLDPLATADLRPTDQPTIASTQLRRIAYSVCINEHVPAASVRVKDRHVMPAGFRDVPCQTSKWIVILRPLTGDASKHPHARSRLAVSACMAWCCTTVSSSYRVYETSNMPSVEHQWPSYTGAMETPHSRGACTDSRCGATLTRTMQCGCSSSIGANGPPCSLLDTLQHCNDCHAGSAICSSCNSLDARIWHSGTTNNARTSKWVNAAPAPPTSSRTSNMASWYMRKASHEHNHQYIDRKVTRVVIYHDEQSPAPDFAIHQPKYRTMILMSQRGRLPQSGLSFVSACDSKP